MSVFEEFQWKYAYLLNYLHSDRASETLQSLERPWGSCVLPLPKRCTPMIFKQNLVLTHRAPWRLIAWIPPPC